MAHNPHHLLSFGDHVLEGNFNLHSSFDNVLNYFRESTDHAGTEWLSLVSKQIGHGPQHLVFTNFEKIKNELKISQSLHLQKTKSGFQIITQDKNLLHLKAETKYDSTLDQIRPVYQDMIPTILEIESALIQKAPKESLSYLLTSEFTLESFSSQRFNDQLKKKFQILISQIENPDNFPESLLPLKGLGVGLTPSGDDFIAGFLLSMKIFNIKFDDKIHVLYKKEAQNLSDHFISNTVRGLFSSPWKNFLHSLMRKELTSRELQDQLNIILSIGATSGADTLVGFCKGVRFVCKFWPHYAKVNTTTP